MSTLDDRPCKVAIWLYDWTDGWLQSAESHALEFDILLNLANAGVSVAAGKTVGAFVGFIAATIGFGPSPDDLAYAVMTDNIVRGLVLLAGENLIDKVTEETIPTTAAKFTAKRDEFICQLSQGATPEQVATNLNQFFQDNFELPERILLKMFIPDTFLNLFHYSADWWPGFETDYLAGISETCCGDFEPGAPLLPSSDQGCQTAHWIIDNLTNTFAGIHNYMSAYFTPMGDGQIIPYPFLDDTPRFFELVRSELPGYIPAKIITRAGNITAFYWSIAQYLNYHLGEYINQPGSLFETTWYDLSTYTAGQKSALLSSLQAALDTQDAYDALYDPLAAWVDANVSTDYANYVKTAIGALLVPNADGSKGLAALMFYQAADLAFYATDDCAGTSPDEEFLDGGDGWIYVSGSCSAGTPKGNEQEGDGVHDGIVAGTYVYTWHRVEFTPQLINAGATMNVFWIHPGAGYMNLSIQARIDGIWRTLRTSSYQATTGRWESDGGNLGNYAGQSIDAMQFNGSGGFQVDGYRFKNVGA